MRYRDQLPQLHGSLLATDGGMETSLIFHHGFDLPCFASFPLLESDEGRAALDAYLEPFLALARRHAVGFVLEAATWRANPSWGEQLGYSPEALAEVNRRANAYLEEIRAREETPSRPFLISGAIGPESDAYNPDHHLSSAEAEAFHSWQIGVFAETAADLVTAFTITYTEEAVGVVRAAAAAGIPAVISFTVETDGRLPSGQGLADAIEEVDGETDNAAAYFMVNCAHPRHVLPVLEEREWPRVLGLRANASKKSHAELDEAEELDDGDPAEFADGYLAIRERLPHLTVLGGCCGTDHRHVTSVFDAWFAA